jgi:hypothetical protein
MSSYCSQKLSRYSVLSQAAALVPYLELGDYEKWCHMTLLILVFTLLAHLSYILGMHELH